MDPTLGTMAPLYEALWKIDQELAERTRESGCPFCGGPLDYGRWSRKPRGCTLPADLSVPHGLCCRVEGCRKRTLPPSTLFMGRRVYWASVVWLSVVARQRRLEGHCAQALRKRFGISSRTLERWISYFETTFARTRSWRTLRGLVPATVRDTELPTALLAVFESHSESGMAALIRCLRVLAYGTEARFSRGSPSPQK